MLDCLDEFKLGCGCGIGPCCCGRRKVLVSDSRGGCTPVLHDPHKLFGPAKCAARGGTMTIHAPAYELTVENPPDDIQRNSDGSPVIIDGKVVAREA